MNCIFQVLKAILTSLGLPAVVLKILLLPLEITFFFFASPCNILYTTPFAVT